MAGGFTVTGVDLDALFKSRTAVKRGDVAYVVGNGVGTQGDVSNRYEKSLADGLPTGDQIPFNTNFLFNGVDLRYYFKSLAASTTTPTPTTPPPSYNLTIAHDGTGTGSTGDTDGGTNYPAGIYPFYAGDVISIYATPAMGSYFVIWNAIGVTPTIVGNHITFVMPAGGVTITATFNQTTTTTTTTSTTLPPTYNLTIAHNGSGGGVTGDTNGGSNWPAGIYPFYAGNVVSLYATASIGSYFSAWNAIGVTPTIIGNWISFVMPAGAVTVTATFNQTTTTTTPEPTYSLNVIHSGTGAGVTGDTDGASNYPVGVYQFYAGDVINLYATADIGNSFSNWSCSDVTPTITGNHVTFVMPTNAVTVNAIFDITTTTTVAPTTTTVAPTTLPPTTLPPTTTTLPPTYTLTVAHNGAGSGYTGNTNGASNYPVGTYQFLAGALVNVYATANMGSYFSAWNALGVTPTIVGNHISFNMPAGAVTVTATFNVTTTTLAPTTTFSPTTTPNPTTTLAPTTPAPTTPAPDVLPTYATFSPSSGQTHNYGTSTSVSHTGNDGTNPVSRLWYYWNGSTYTSSGDTSSSHSLGSGPYQGTPDNLGGGLYRYYYTVRLTNGAGNTNPQNDASFGWYMNIWVTTTAAPTTPAPTTPAPTTPAPTTTPAP